MKAALLILGIALFLSPGAPAGAAQGEGVELLRQGRHREAIELLREERRLSPLDPVLKRGLASSCLALGGELINEGKLTEAAPLLREGGELAPEEGLFPLYLGLVSLRQGAPDEAEVLLLAALRLAGPSPQVYQLLAQTCYAQGRLHEAESFLEQAVDLDPGDQGSRHFLVKVRRELQIEGAMEQRHGGNFSITYIEGGERLGSQALEVLQTAYAELGSLFNLFPGQPVEVILYGNRDFSTVTGAPEWAGGAYDGKIRVPVGGVTAMNENLRRIFRHEYAHLLVFSQTRGNIPRWLDEGLAQVAEGEWPANHPPLSVPRGEQGAVSFARLEHSFTGLSGPEAGTAYLQSREFVRFLLERYGWPRMLDLLQALGAGEAFGKAVARLLVYPEEDLAELQQEWLADHLLKTGK